MTIPPFGKLTPVQGMMLGLIGYKIARSGATLDISAQKRRQIIRKARQDLVECTGQDFGYSLQHWHTYLSHNARFEYTHPYAYQAVRDAVFAAYQDRTRQGIVHDLESELTKPSISEKGTAQRARHLIETYHQPLPQSVAPSIRSDVGLLEAWQWAQDNERLDLLSGLARPVSALILAPERQQFKEQLQQYADQVLEQEETKWYADLLLVLAKLESDKNRQFDLYQKALKLYAELGDGSWEAFCAYQLAGLYRYWRQFDSWQQMHMHAFRCWSQERNYWGIGISLIHLGEVLERAGNYKQACQLYYRAKHMLRDQKTSITARDILKRVSYENQVAAEEYQTDKSVGELIAEFFDGPYVKGHRPLPVIYADDDHLHLQHRNDFQPLNYHILPSPGFILSVEGYRLPSPPGMETKSANLLQLVRGKNQIYTYPWQEDVLLVRLTAETLQPIPGAPPFLPLESGERLILAIGHIDNDQVFKSQPQFIPYWVTIIKVLDDL